jgi:hypothetical protein
VTDGCDVSRNVQRNNCRRHRRELLEVMRHLKNRFIRPLDGYFHHLFGIAVFL